MTRERMKELLPVAQAYVDGATVQWETQIAYKVWIDYGDPSTGGPGFLDVRYQWRVKPQIQEFWMCPYCLRGYLEKRECSGAEGAPTHPPSQTVLVREVVE